VSTNAPAVTLVGRYELGQMIGQGGMSQVWRARDHRLERDVAVKILHPGLSSTPLNRERFEREALAAARVNHPNVVAVYDAGEQDGELFIVMECLPGHTLYEEMARGPIEVERARTIALQLLRGLGAAHALGIVHRDIKPGNVLFAADGTAKLADFGIAKFTEAADLTKTGQMVGTAQYLPPERLMGNDATASGDLYSLGVVLYEALAGRRPFEGETPLALVRAIESTTPTPIREVRTDVDAGFARAIDGATAKDPAHRFESAAAMSAALASRQRALTWWSGRSR
jgi:serine/threonine protein kinase